jgi:hypothetical protein
MRKPLWKELKAMKTTLGWTIALLLTGAAQAQSEDAGDLAKASQNPIGNMVSLPFQNNTSFGIGPNDAVSNALNIQPVYPVSLSPKWNLVSRAIVPLIYREEVFPGPVVPRDSATSATPRSSRRPNPGS